MMKVQQERLNFFIFLKAKIANDESSQERLNFLSIFLRQKLECRRDEDLFSTKNSKV